jgi:hypothetical protein
MGDFANRPKILRGAFVEFGISVPPLLVVFQFNPLTISRSRSSYVNPPQTPMGTQAEQNADFIQQIATGGASSLIQFRNGQNIIVQPQTISFDIRLDATDKLDQGDTITEQFGIAPKLSTLELMMLPKSQSLLGGAINALLGGAPKNFAFFDSDRNPPIILFVWGRKQILPVNITSMQVREEEFSVDLNPTRATVSVNLEVIEGPNLPFLYTEGLTEVMSLLNLANIAELANTIVPQ